jgi:hypothetical protein
LVAVAAFPCRGPTKFAAYTIPVLQLIPTAVLLVYVCPLQEVVKDTPYHEDITKLARLPPRDVPESTFPSVM